MRFLMVSDLHFSSRAQDEYFFDLFPKIDEEIERHNIDCVIVPGDLTTAKDNHSSKLVNRTVRGLFQWAQKVPVKIVMGNHDLKTLGSPFFQFVGKYPGIDFISEPKEENGMIFFPYSKTLEEDLEQFDIKNKIVIAHVSVAGSVFETGTACEEGIDPEVFAKTKLTFSGDIHSPQQVGPVIYVGCPYNIRMNDQFQGSFIVLDTDTVQWTRYPLDFPKRRTLDITNVENLKVQIEALNTLDQVKVRLHLDQKNMGQWRQIKEDVRAVLAEAGIVLSAFETPRTKLEPVALSKTKEIRFSDFDSYCAAQSISPELQKLGAEIIAEASK